MRITLEVIKRKVKCWKEYTDVRWDKREAWLRSFLRSSGSPASQTPQRGLCRTNADTATSLTFSFDFLLDLE